MLAQLRPAAVLLGLLTLITGVLYPVLVTALAHLAFPGQSSGSLIVQDGRAVGSALIGQPFQGERWFWGRLSATSRVPYDAAASSGSNLGPMNPTLVAAARARLDALAATGESGAPVPVDIVTASASGLDPHVSPAAAQYQVERVARARGLEPARVRQLVARHTEGRTFGVLGEPRVNVLQLNRALEALGVQGGSR